MNYRENKINFSVELAVHKIKIWCAYQERSQNETRYKLFSYGIFSEDVELIISNLIEENFINEQRFAFAFTSGKFRIKKWGKNKIKIELTKHKISDFCIQNALNSIDKNDYEETLKQVIEKKIRLSKLKDNKFLFNSCYSYVISRGFESDMCIDFINRIIKIN